MFVCFFFQAEDGIRDRLVTGVQTCALPILPPPKTILIIFYEGNDIADNLKFIAENYRGNQNITELVSSIKFNKWLNHQFQESIDENRSGFETNLIFTKRSEEHTSELQSQAYLVCRLLLEKKK